MRRWMGMLVVVVLTPPALAGEVTYEKTYDVEQGAWLEIACPAGTITIDGWDQSKVEVVAYHEPDVEVRSRQVRGDVQVGTAGDKHGHQSVEYEVRVPVWMNVDITGNQTEADIRDVDGQIRVETIDGDVFVQGGRERIVLHSVKGDVRLEGAEGEIELVSTNGEVTVVDSKGSLIVTGVNGDVRCANVVSPMVEAETLNGDILFDGTLASDGDYYFTTHIGDIELSVPRDIDVAVTVVTYRGEFSTDFDAEPERDRQGVDQRRWTMKIGQATAQLRAESFQGDIELFSSKRGRGKRG